MCLVPEPCVSHRANPALADQDGWVAEWGESLGLNCRCKRDAWDVTVLVGVSSDFSSEE